MIDITKCPGCGSNNIYNSGFTIECSSFGCDYYSPKCLPEGAAVTRQDAREGVVEAVSGAVLGGARITYKPELVIRIPKRDRILIPDADCVVDLTPSGTRWHWIIEIEIEKDKNAADKIAAAWKIS